MVRPAAPDKISVVLVAVLYWLAEELQDLIMLGFKTYVHDAGWLNLIDWLCILSGLMTFVAFFMYLGQFPDTSQAFNYHFWSLSAR